MLSLLTLSTALALTSAPDAFRFEYSTRTNESGSAYLVVRAAQAQEGVLLTLSGSDGSSLTRTLNLPAGGNLKIKWAQFPDTVHYEVRFGRQQGPAFAFDVRRPVSSGADLAKLELLSSDRELVHGHKIRYRLPFAIIRYHNTVYGLDGQVLAENKSSGELSYAAGEELNLSWSSDEEVFLIKTRVEDVAGRYAQDIRAPWSFDIPHTDLVFASGSSKIPASETPKLDEAFAILSNTLARLDKAASAVRGSIPVTLFVVGHTDTVGSSASNQRLSMARARSIARYFHKKGVWCGIEYAGMGEEGQAVATADNVDNQANRRAVYTLALSTPTGEGRPTPTQYKTLSRPRPRALAELPALPASYVQSQTRLASRSPQAEQDTALPGPQSADAPAGPRRAAQGPLEASSGAASPPALASASSDQTKAPASSAKPETSQPSVPLQPRKAPGAHANKDCAVVSERSSTWSMLIALLGTLGWRRRSRNRRRAA